MAAIQILMTEVFKFDPDFTQEAEALALRAVFDAAMRKLLAELKYPEPLFFQLSKASQADQISVQLDPYEQHLNMKALAKRV